MSLIAASNHVSAPLLAVQAALEAAERLAGSAAEANGADPHALVDGVYAPVYCLERELNGMVVTLAAHDAEVPLEAIRRVDEGMNPLKMHLPAEGAAPTTDYAPFITCMREVALLGGKVAIIENLRQALGTELQLPVTPRLPPLLHGARAPAALGPPPVLCVRLAAIGIACADASREQLRAALDELAAGPSPPPGRRIPAASLVPLAAALDVAKCALVRLAALAGYAPFFAAARALGGAGGAEAALADSRTALE
ncbi:hypothetical protein T492DRAFT_896227, partial [Pavlovales sp. CCMP2436]